MLGKVCRWPVRLPEGLKVMGGVTHEEEPAWQNCGATQLVRSVDVWLQEASVLLAVMVWLPLPVQMYWVEGVQVTVTWVLGFAVPPGPVHEPEYVVVFVGETDVLPLVPLMVKLDPVQEDAFVHDHESVELLLWVIEAGEADRVHEGAGVATVTLNCAYVVQEV